MRFRHNYIALCVNGDVNDDTAKRWLTVVRKVSPNGVLSSTSITVNGERKSSDFYVYRDGDDIHYVVPLSRDLLEDEAARIAIAWDRVSEDGDFEIDFSQHDQAMMRKKVLQSSILAEIAERAAKMLHSEWMNGKVEKGWNYGPSYNPSRKQHPMLLPWEQLSESNRSDETSRITRLFEILDAINLRLVAK